MIDLNIFIESRFPVDRKRIKKLVEAYLSQKKLRNNIMLAVAMVGDRKMRSLNRIFARKDHTTPVLSFPLEDPKSGITFIYPPSDFLKLGDVVISYPQAVSEAAFDNMLVDDKIDELLLHGLNNLILTI